MVEQFHLQVEEQFVIKLPLKDVYVEVGKEKSTSLLGTSAIYISI